ncbi:MAG: tRNA (adenosine(37)-N6)-threonylcarbamoyltransferase complex ATPase subunit type 1 TsaE [Planctomycetota bacterium]|nr:MAG: tRNA (adenosine(37)-N6)-threonylcarbamoyltransferase complex ATPase subunit type 1 TsaE [Planctomycetota bacterium]
MEMDEGELAERRHVVELTDESATRRFAQEIAQLLSPPLTIALNGALGTGKTFFVRAVGQACGVPPEEITSPTYVLLQRYSSRRGPIYHLDLYRLNHVDEAWDLGIDELCEGNNLVFIEWAERFPQALPPDCLTIEFRMEGSRRYARLSASGPRSSDILQQFLDPPAD